MHHLIQLIHLSPKPIFLSNMSKKLQLTWLDTFSISSLQIILHFKSESMSSLAIKEASRICLPYTSILRLGYYLTHHLFESIG